MRKLIESIERARRASALSAYDGRLAAYPPPTFPVEGKRVLLVYLFDGLGDNALLAPTVRSLLARRPREVGLLVPPLGARILKTMDLPVRIHVYRGPEGDAARALEAQLARRRYEIAVDLSLRGGIDSRRWLAASGAEVRLGWIKPGERLEQAGLTFATPDTRHETILHWSRYCTLPLEPLGVTAPSHDVRFNLSKPVRNKAAALWRAAVPRPKARVAVIPGGRQSERRWDERRFAAVARSAARDRGAAVVVIGGPNERELVRLVTRAAAPAARPYTGKDLALLVAILATADAVVTNDTGPMHVAFMLERPTIALFQYMSPLVWGPPRVDPRFVVLRPPAERALEDPTAQDAPTDAWTRTVLHHLEGLLARSPG